MRQVIKHRDIRLLNMIRRTDPEIPRKISKLENLVEWYKRERFNSGLLELSEP